MHEMWKLGSQQMQKNKVTTRLAMRFVRSRCRVKMAGTANSMENLCDEVETVNRFCYLEDRWNASDNCEAAVIVTVQIGRVRFRESDFS